MMPLKEREREGANASIVLWTWLEWWDDGNASGWAHQSDHYPFQRVQFSVKKTFIHFHSLSTSSEIGDGLKRHKLLLLGPSEINSAASSWPAQSTGLHIELVGRLATNQQPEQKFRSNYHPNIGDSSVITSVIQQHERWNEKRKCP